MAGLLTATNMAAAVRRNLGNRTTTDLPDSTVQVWMNWALDHISSPRVYRHPELWDVTTQALVSGTYRYTIDTAGSPVDTVAVIAVVAVSSTDATQRIRLRPVRLRDGFEQSATVTSGSPTEYALYSPTQIEVYATPSTTYDTWNLLIRRVKVATAFDLSGSPNVKSPLHRYFDEPLVLGAIWRGWREMKETVRAEAAKAEFAQVLNEVTDRLTIEAEDRDWGPDLYLDEAMP